jgi:hypothetical protein
MREQVKGILAEYMPIDQQNKRTASAVDDEDEHEGEFT